MSADCTERAVFYSAGWRPWQLSTGAGFHDDSEVSTFLSIVLHINIILSNSEWASSLELETGPAASACPDAEAWPRVRGGGSARGRARACGLRSCLLCSDDPCEVLSRHAAAPGCWPSWSWRGWRGASPQLPWVRVGSSGLVQVTASLVTWPPPCSQHEAGGFQLAL